MTFNCWGHCAISALEILKKKIALIDSFVNLTLWAIGCKLSSIFLDYLPIKKVIRFKKYKF